MSRACSGKPVTAIRTLFASRSQLSASGASSSSPPASSQLPLSTALPRNRTFCTTTSVHAKPRRDRGGANPFKMDQLRTFEHDDIPTLGHMILDRHRQYLKYARLVEWELPKLIELRKEYVPPRSDEILRVRSMHYQGDEHPATNKSVITVRVEDLFNSGKLTSQAARRKFLLLAGSHWMPFEKKPLESPYSERRRPVSGSAKATAASSSQQSSPPPELNIFAQQEEVEKLAIGTGVGTIKISSDRYPYERMNLKWCSDAMDRLIDEANNKPEEMNSIPLDLRHVKAREARREGFAKRYAPTISSFPKEWLSPPSDENSS